MYLSGNVDSGGFYGVRSDMEHATHLQALSDEELLAHSLQHPAAFEVLVARYQHSFLERAQYVVKGHDEAEDVVQETFIRVYRFAPKFRGEAGSFKSWSLTILMNVARTRYQRLATKRARFAALDPEHYEQLPSPNEDDAIEAKDIIERTLPLLPPDAARILSLAFLEGLAYSAIAEKEGITEGAVKTRVHRAKKALRETIGDITL